MLRRFLNLEEGWLTFALMTIMIMSVVWSVEAAQWVDDIHLLPWVTLSGILIGLLFSKLRLPGLLLHLLALITGSSIVVYAMARTLPDAPYSERMFEVVDRLYSWLEVAIGSKGIGTDNLLFLMMLAALSWLIGYVSTWTIFRMHSIWWAIMACGAAIVVNLSYAYTLIGYFFLFMITAMLLVVRFNIFKQERFWKAQRVEYDRGIQWGFLRDSMVACVAVLFLAYIIPPTTISASANEAWNQVTSPWNDVQSEFNRVFAGLRPRNDFTVSGFGKTLALKGTVRLSNAIVMYVSSPEPRYWRAVSLDQYTSNGFIWSDKATTQIVPGDLRLVESNTYDARVEKEQLFKILTPKGSWLFGGGQPISATVPINVNGPLADPSAVHGLSALKRGDTYSVTTSVSVAAIEQLRVAGENYPAYVRRVYTQLPSTLPERVREEARKLTAGYDNPYDKASAIEKHLRENYKYNTNVAAPPRERDGVDYFLFEGREGYCDYYATAMAVLLRSVGIPSRVVTGYMAGELDPTLNQFIVRESNSHAWVEVYFPRYGWVEFEPTPSQPPLARFSTNVPQSGVTSPTGIDEMYPEDMLGEEEEEFLKERPSLLTPESSTNANTAITEAARNVLMTLLLLGLVLAGIFYWWQRAYSGLSLPQSFYARMTRLASWFGLRPEPAQTPYEYARSLAGSLPGGQNQVGLITDTYVRSEFGHKLVNEEEGAKLNHAWLGVRREIVRNVPARVAATLRSVSRKIPMLLRRTAATTRRSQDNKPWS